MDMTSLGPCPEFLPILAQPVLVGFPNGPVLLSASLAHAENINFVPLPATFDPHLPFLLLGIARRGRTPHFFSIVVGLELDLPCVPLRLPAHHQVMVPARPDLGQVFFRRISRREGGLPLQTGFPGGGPSLATAREARGPLGVE